MSQSIPTGIHIVIGSKARIDRCLVPIIIVAATFAVTLTLLAAKPADFGPAQVEEIWKELWKSGGPKLEEPSIERLTEKDVTNQMIGNWSVMFGVAPDKVTVSLSTNRLVEVSGEKDGKAWKKTGQWRVGSNKLVLFLEQDSLPSFIFRFKKRHWIFDPWATTLMSELKREK